MTKYVFAYTGGSGMPETEAEQAELMQAWGAWFGQMGEAVVDGGNPFGPSTTVSPDGSAGGAGASGLGGFSVVQADSLEAAAELAKGCPVLTGGGNVEVYEALDM